MTIEKITELLNVQHTIILDRLAKLTSTDYIANKIAEGNATTEQYAEKIELRLSWRNDINNALEEIKRLESLPIDKDPIIEEMSLE